MVLIGRRRTSRRLFENFKNSQKSQNSNFRILVHHFLCLCLLCIVKKLDSIRTKLTEEIDFEVCPYGNSNSGTAAAACRSAGYSDWTGSMAACSDRSSGAFGTGGVRNWGRNLAVKTNRLVLPLILQTVIRFVSDIAVFVLTKDVNSNQPTIAQMMSTRGEEGTT